MKHINKLSSRIAIAVIIGFLLASSRTTITYSCVPIDGAMGCVSFEDAIMHPNDLLNNRQNSLVRFSTTFAISSLVTFALINAVNVTYKKKT